MPPGPRSHRIRLIISILLLIAAALYWLEEFGFESLGLWVRAGIVVAAIAAFIPSIRRAINSLCDRCNSALSGRANLVAVCVGVLVAVYLFAFAYACRDRLFLKLNDEHAYMIQARMLARGRLWMPAYPPEVAPFFDALAMIVDRVYAPMYFPGTALAAVPFVWLGLPFWVMPIVTASIAAGLLYLVFAQMFDPVRGLLAVILLASMQTYRANAIVLLAEAPFLAAEMVVLWGWLKFRKDPRGRWAAIIGAAAGYAAITRPLDALCMALPIGLAIVLQTWNMRRILRRSCGAVLLGASPFLLLLVAQNTGVTGRPLELAEAYYNRENFPASPMGFHTVDADFLPRDANILKRQWLRYWVIPSFQRHTLQNALTSWYRGRLVQTLQNALPDPILLLLLPISLLSMTDASRRVLVGIVPLFLVGYAIYLFFLNHYVVSIMPSMICMIFLGWEFFDRQFPNSRWAGAFFPILLIAAALPELWPIAPIPSITPDFAQDQIPANHFLSQLPRMPAVVLFRFDPAVEQFSDDPVYNDGVAWPDDAPVVRARDFGAERNRAIVQYYARRQPDRVFYVYDPDVRAAGGYPILGPFGTARDLAITGTVP
jgi:hypothetical protein